MAIRAAPWNPFAFLYRTFVPEPAHLLPAARPAPVHREDS